MRRWAMLCPGQGMELPRMGLSVARRDGQAHALLERVSATVDLDVLRLLERGGRALGQTSVLQPLLTAVSLGAFLALGDRGPRADFVAGHSLGEVAAWAATGAVAAEDAVDLAVQRGRLMAREAGRTVGGMEALKGSAVEVEGALELGRHHGVVDLAAHNAPDVWVISGERAALRPIAAALPCQVPQVSGPWHCRLMSSAVEGVRAATRRLRAPHRPSGQGKQPVPLVCNRRGDLAAADQIPDLLAEQLVNPVQWTAVLATLAAAGVTDYVTLGPGHVLAGLVRKNLGGQVRVHPTERFEEIERLWTLENG